MSSFVMAGDPRVLLHHLALYGLGAILEDAGVTGLALRWGATPTVEGQQLDAQRVDEAVRSHAAAHAHESSWVMRSAEIEGARRGLMSPRLSTFKEPDTWREVQRQRHEELRALTDAHAWADLRFLGALGEPCYWSKNAKGESLQDDGASRLEMQPRNRGSEIVSNRLRPLAQNVAARRSGRVAAGLDGTAPVDELGRERSDGVTATGLTVPGPVDNVLVWCALWGISALPLAPRVNNTASTSGHLGPSRQGWFYAPVWSRPWRPARLRTILASASLHTAAAKGLGNLAADVPEERAAGTWLQARGVDGIVRFPIGRFGSDNAPERRALGGESVRLSVRS